MFDVYDKDFKKITIDYLDYLNSKVVASEYVDYETNTIKPNESGKIEVKHRMKRKTVDKNDYDLIDLHPDYRLSTSTRRIPFLNMTDSVRISIKILVARNRKLYKNAGKYKIISRKINLQRLYV